MIVCLLGFFLNRFIVLKAINYRCMSVAIKIFPEMAALKTEILAIGLLIPKRAATVLDRPGQTTPGLAQPDQAWTSLVLAQCTQFLGFS